jgi:hypothetical protein
MNPGTGSRPGPDREPVRPDVIGPPPGRWPSLDDLQAAVGESRQIVTRAAGRVAHILRNMDRLANNRADIDRQQDRIRRRRRGLVRAERCLLDRLTRLDEEWAERTRRLKEEVFLRAKAMDGLPEPVPAELASYVEARIELRRMQGRLGVSNRRVARWRAALTRCRARLGRAEAEQTRLAGRRAAYVRAGGGAARVLAVRRGDLGAAAAELVRAAALAARTARLHQAQARDLAALDRRPAPDRAPRLPKEDELARLEVLIGEDFSRQRTRQRISGRLAAKSEVGRRCLEQLDPLNRHIEEAGRQLEAALGLITPQAQPDYLCCVVLPRLEILDDELAALDGTARSTEARRERLASSLKVGLERLAALGRPGTSPDLEARLASWTAVLARGRAWEKSRRRWLLTWHRDLTVFKAEGVFPDLAPALDRLYRRHRALRQAWRAYGQRLEAAAGALPVPRQVDSGVEDPTADQVRRRLGLTRVRLTDLERTRELLRRSAEPLRTRPRTPVDPRPVIDQDGRVRQLEAMVERLSREVKQLTAPQPTEPAPEPERAGWDAPRVQQMLADTAPVIAFLAGELEQSRAAQRRLAREATEREARQGDVQAALDQSRAQTAEAETELARLRAEVEASRLAAGFLSRMLALTAVAGVEAGQSLGQLQQALAARGEEVQALKEQLARLSVLYFHLLKYGPPGKGEALTKRLSGFARRTLPHALAVILAAGSMLLVHPTTASDAAYAPVPAVPAALSPALSGPTLVGEIGVRPFPLAQIHYFPLNARIDLSGLPPGQAAAGPRAVVAGIDARVDALVRRSRLSRPVFLDTAHRTLDTSHPIKLTALDALARRIRNFGSAHPHIFRDAIQHQFLAQAMTLLEKVPLETGRKTNWFRDRLYFDLVAAGMTRRQALVAVVTNARAARALRRTLPRRLLFTGQTRPLPAVEGMNLVAFVKRFSPFIADTCRRYLKAHRRAIPADLTHYARRLAFDIYCAAKTFRVPLTLMLNIPHQETYYANVLGDSRRSASPFQIFAPTKRLILQQMSQQAFRLPPPRIKLENHLTLAAYLAAYHLRQLIDRQTVGFKRGNKTRWRCNLDNVVAAYNGSRKYIRGIKQKRRHLLKYLQTTGRPRADGSAKGPSAGLGRPDRGRT